MSGSGLTLDERASIDFALFLRRRWTDVVYPALSAQYAAAAGAESGSEDVERLATGTPVFP